MQETPRIQENPSPASGAAIASLVLGILAYTSCCGCFILAVPAVIFGHLAIRSIRKGERSGKGLALAGLILGYISIALTVLLAIYAILSTLIG